MLKTNKKKINILYVLGSMNNGGTEAFLMNYFRKINKNKFQCDFFIFGGKNDYYKNEIIKFKSKYFHYSHNNSFKNYLLFYNFLNCNKHYDIIHIHSCSLIFLLFCSLISKLTKSKYIIGHSHSNGIVKNSIINNIFRYFAKLLISRNIDYGFACSMDTAKAKFTNSLIDSKRFYLIPNSIDTTKFLFNNYNRNVVRRKFNIGNEFVIGSIGRLDKNKNHTFLLDIISLINDKNVKLIIIGNGTEKDSILKKAKKLRISKNVILINNTSEPEKYYSAFDVFCLPSYVEGFPLTLIEAQANGLICCISKNITKETNITKKNLYLPIDNADKWITPITDSYRLDKKNVMYKIKKFDIKYNILQLEKIYRTIITMEEK